MTQRSHSNRREWVIWALSEYEGRLTRYATRILGDEDSARDVVQHAFLRLCDRAPEDLGDRVAPWLYAVCRNKAMDMLRGRKHTEPLGSAESGFGVSREPDPAATVETRDLYACLNQLVATLPMAQREAVDLWTEGFSYRQIAEVTQQKEGNVRLLVHRALKRLREHPATRRLLDGEPRDDFRADAARQPVGNGLFSPSACHSGD
jgi:RNA polymerase sigma-70 factor (ECF subfamily)